MIMSGIIEVYTKEDFLTFWKEEFFSRKRQQAEDGLFSLLQGQIPSSQLRGEAPYSLINLHICPRKDSHEIGYCYVYRATSVDVILQNFSQAYFTNCHKILLLKKNFYRVYSQVEIKKFETNDITVLDFDTFLTGAVKHFFTYEQQVYERLQRPVVMELNYAAFIAKLEQGATVLDLGSGGDTCGIVKTLVNAGCEVTTLDSWKTVGADLIFRYQVRFVEGNLYADLPRLFLPNTFDGITSIHVIFHSEENQWVDFIALFDAFKTILKPEGYFLITIGASRSGEFQDLGEEAI
jgi:2-polyprenyl-3-methyl-5-hydroxy-6-metoxy-1,4-benzoquinol methylase